MLCCVSLIRFTLRRLAQCLTIIETRASSGLKTKFAAACIESPHTHLLRGKGANLCETGRKPSAPTPERISVVGLTPKRGQLRSLPMTQLRVAARWASTSLGA